jgi:hypothetical protein
VFKDIESLEKSRPGGRSGRIVHADTAAGLRTNAMVQKAYLGITQ